MNKIGLRNYVAHKLCILKNEQSIENAQKQIREYTVEVRYHNKSH